MVGNSSTNNNLTVSLFEIVIQCRFPPPVTSAVMRSPSTKGERYPEVKVK